MHPINNVISLAGSPLRIPALDSAFGAEWPVALSVIIAGIYLSVCSHIFLEISHRVPRERCYIRAIPFFFFGFFSAVYLVVMTNPDTGGALQFSEAHGTGFFLCAMGAFLEITAMLRKLRENQAPNISAELSVACLFSAAALIDNLAVAAGFLPLMLSRWILCHRRRGPSRDEQELWTIVAVLNRQIADTASEIEAIRRSAEQESANPVFWLLPNLPDEAVLAQLRSAGMRTAENREYFVYLDNVTEMITGRE